MRSNEPLGIVEEGQRRTSIFSRFLPGATPLPAAGATKPLLEEIERLKAKVETLETDNAWLKSLTVEKTLEKVQEDQRRKAGTIDMVIDEYLKALALLGFRLHGRPLTLIDLASQQRSRVYAQPRHVAMWLCVRLTGQSLPKIAQVFGGRDHTSVMHGRRKAPEIIEAVPVLRAASLLVLAAFGVNE